MAYDKFLVAPFKDGLRDDLAIQASFDIVTDYMKGCFMPRKYTIRKDQINETGNRYGMLTVIDQAPKKHPKRRGALWRCKCDCGNYCIVPGGALRYNGRKSCGCLRERTIENTGLNILIGSYKTKAAKRNFFFNISRADFYRLIKDNCFYCGKEPSQIIKRQKSKKIQIKYNGIDRIDPSKGYSLKNCVTCCKYCNKAKGTLSLEEWNDFTIRRYECLKKISSL